MCFQGFLTGDMWENMLGPEVLNSLRQWGGVVEWYLAPKSGSRNLEPTGGMVVWRREPPPYVVISLK